MKSYVYKLKKINDTCDIEYVTQPVINGSGGGGNKTDNKFNFL